jgi:nitric oxide reductase subunit B
MSLKKLKWAAIISFVISMLGLLGGGYLAKDRVPPYPGKVVDSEGKILFQKSDILAGQDVYQRYGLMDRMSGDTVHREDGFSPAPSISSAML